MLPITSIAEVVVMSLEATKRKSESLGMPFNKARGWMWNKMLWNYAKAAKERYGSRAVTNESLGLLRQ